MGHYWHLALGAVGITASKKFCMIARRPGAVIYNFPTDHFANFGRGWFAQISRTQKIWADFTRLATEVGSSLAARVYPLVWGPCGPACLSASDPPMCRYTEQKSRACPMPYPVRPKFCPHKVSPFDAKGLTINTEIDHKTCPKEVNWFLHSHRWQNVDVRKKRSPASNTVVWGRQILLIYDKSQQIFELKNVPKSKLTSMLFSVRWKYQLKTDTPADQCCWFNLSSARTNEKERQEIKNSLLCAFQSIKSGRF